MWEEADAAPQDSDAAVQSLQAEGRRSLATWDSLRRMFATATAPWHTGIPPRDDDNHVVRTGGLRSCVP